MFDIKKCLNDSEHMMTLAVKHLDEALSRIRAGKANVGILADVKVESYGTMMPLNQVSAVTTPDARTIAIKPWDKNMIKAIEKAIINSNVGITPDNNGEVIRLTIPPLTEERRKELVKQCNKEGESARVSIRNARREALERLKKSTKEGVSEDNEKDAEQDLQKIHDKYIKQLDEILAKKNKEIMTV